MARRRKSDPLGPLIGAGAVILFFFGASIVLFLKALIFIVLIGAGISAGCFLVYRLARLLWESQSDVQEYLPVIDWTVPSTPALDMTWMEIRYPEFDTVRARQASNVMGTSGAWKDLTRKLEPFPCLRGASGPRELQARISGCDARAQSILQRAFAVAADNAGQQQLLIEHRLGELRGAEEVLTRKVQPQLELLRMLVESLASGHFFERRKARQLDAQVSEFESQLSTRCEAARESFRRQEGAVRQFLDPVQREQALRARFEEELAGMREVVKSKEFAGAQAEVALIEELSGLSADFLVFNDVKLESNRYIHFQGKPLMSAQIDTLVIGRAGVFVVEVKNWSREFAQSGEGFDPFEQVSRASYLVYDQLRSAGLSVKVRSIIAPQRSLPSKGDQKVAVVRIGDVRAYIQRFGGVEGNVHAMRAALQL